jgi:hypothetical protein
MIAAGLTKGNWDLRLCEVSLSLGKGEVGFVKHERRTL